MNFLVTGGRGFIGSHFIDRILKDEHIITDIDSLTYASNKNLPFDINLNYRHFNLDINELDIDLSSYDFVINFAAETHVDNSIENSSKFLQTNILGVAHLLNLIIKSKKQPKFIQISTDEVYGSSNLPCNESTILKPGNPYSASKAAAEHLVTSYCNTYGLNYLITRSTNNYGPRQFEEKLIPKSIKKAKENGVIPIYGSGLQKRDWIRVEDNVDAIYSNLHLNGIINIGIGNLLTSTEVASKIIEKIGSGTIEYVKDRPGHDFCYTIDNSLLYSTEWRPKYNSFNLDWIT